MIETLHIVLAMKPLEGNFVENAERHGVAGLNIDVARIQTEDSLNGGAYARNGSERYDGYDNWRFKRKGGAGEYVKPQGRFPANVILGEGTTDILDRQSGISKSSGGINAGKLGKRIYAGEFSGEIIGQHAGGLGDTGGASRFFKIINQGDKR